MSSQTLLSDPWMTLRADACELPNGKTLNPYYVVEERDWVHVFALSAEGLLLTVEQFRYAGDTVCLELPGGIIDNGEAPLDAARRELLEETGFQAASWSPVGSVFANPARQTNRIHLFIAEGLDSGQAQSLDESEEIAVEFMSIEAVKSMIRSGRFSQSFHIASFYQSLEYLRG